MSDVVVTKRRPAESPKRLRAGVSTSLRLARVMFLYACNVALLIFVFLAVPAITRVKFGSLHIGSDSHAEMLTLAGVSIALAGNIACGLGLIWRWGERRLCWRWAAVWTAIVVLQLLCYHEVVRFGWLKHGLLAMRDMVG